MPRSGKRAVFTASRTATNRGYPPEDSSGPPGYEHLLQALRDPKHEDHEQMREWIGGEFDPEAFDLGKINQGLWRMK